MKERQSTRIIERIYDFTENSKLLQSIRNGLVMIIPITLIGCFSVVLGSLPVSVYQEFITGFADGALKKIFAFIQNGTLGFLAVYLTFAISICYSRQFQSSKHFNYGPSITSVICFCIFSGVLQDSFSMSSFGAQGVFTAVVSALSASALYCALEKRMRKSFRLYADGVDEEFNRAVVMMLPMGTVVGLFAIVNVVFVEVFGVTGFQMFFSETMNHLFDNMGRSMGSMLLFAVLTSVLWVFGIHGNDVLEPVSQSFFIPAMELNQQLIANGEAATEIFSKTFYDCFTLMGGTGNTISLLIALLLFSKRRSNKKLVKFATIPMLFNVNEIVMFGLPIVFNPIMAIPYILVPVVLILISTFAMMSGLVPIPIETMEWTTPAIMSGYMATGSITGSILQVVNIVVGVMIYRPFVKMYDEEKNRDAKKRMDKLVQVLRQSEASDEPVELLSLKSSAGEVAKGIVEDMQHRLSKELPRVYYQPQFDHLGNCIGAEALLRWEHSTYGMLFPPLVVKLATEAGVLRQLEEGVFRAVIKDMEHMKGILGDNTKISVNVTGINIQTEEFERFLKELKNDYPEHSKSICIEITEQTALRFDESLTERLTRIHDMGYTLAIDDFSMGSTSIKYLQTSVFDLVKLDGAISRDVITNSRSREIIASITGLTKNFGIRVLAEYVENEKQRKALEEIDCCLYQGYLYSPAVPVEDFERSVKRVLKKEAH